MRDSVIQPRPLPRPPGRLTACVVLGLLWALLGSTLARAGNVEATLVSERDAAVPGEVLWVALRQDIREGWHTYWRNPGDSGQASVIRWQDLPEGVSVGEIVWPWPERIPYGPLMNYGYHGTLLLPVAVQVPANFAADELVLKAKGEWLVCADVCIPEDAELTLTLPVREASGPSPAAPEFAAARARTPTPLGMPTGASIDGKQIVFEIGMPGLDADRIESVAYFPYLEGLIDNPAPQVYTVQGEALRLTVTQGWDFTPDASLDGVLLIEETAGDTLQVGFEITPVPGGQAATSAAAPISMWLAIGLALLGGAILNLMPCVFPVLSIKILSLVSQSQEEHTKLSAHGWVYAAGVVLSFVAIAGVLIGLRAGGMQIGWGFQLQSPVVVCLLVYLLFLVGLNLAGLFEIGTGIMGLGSRFAEAGGYGGSFATGVLATLVAAPCTAPFMGAAVGFALTQNSATALAVFAALGAGMALPYIALCHAPGLLSRLPRPGPWMARFREFLAFPMFASAVWLLWVLSLQAGSTGVLAAGSGMVLIAFAIWLTRLRVTNTSLRFLRGGASVAMLVAAVALTSGLRGGAAQAAEATPGPGYAGPVAAVYSRDALKAALAEGPVFVNFTAAWCITCKVNEAVALNQSGTRQAFENAGVTYLKGDWTNEDPGITSALAEYGRSGVPLYLYYRPGTTQAEVLPQVLTQALVIETVSRAGEIASLSTSL